MPAQPGEAPAPRFSAIPESGAPAAPEPETAPAAVPAPAARPAAPSGPGGLPATDPTTDIDLPPGSEFNRPRPETEATLPEREETLRETPAMGAPAPAAVAEAPLPDTAPAAAPAPVSAIPETMTPPEAPDAAVDLGAGTDLGAEEPAPAGAALRSPAAPEPATPPAPEARSDGHPATGMQTGTTTAPATGTATGIATGTATGTKPEAAPAIPGAGLPADRDGDAASTLPQPEPDSVPDSGPDTGPGSGNAAPRILPPPGAGAADAPGEPPGDLTPVAPLPTLGTVPGVDATAPSEQGAATGPAPDDRPGERAQDRAAAPAPLGALARNAVAFDPPPGAPLLSLVLVDVGAAGLDRRALLTFPFPVTFAIDPAMPGAAEAAADFHRAGYEVALLASGLSDLPPAEAAARLNRALGLIGSGVAVLDPGTDGFQEDRVLTDAVLGVLAETGHGIVTRDEGLNPAARAADRAGVPEATVFQTLDADGQNTETMRRMLDRAVFEARQTGQAVLVGHSRPETVTALFSWALQSGPGEVALAPLSALLRLP
ncbi:hypothetical protein BYZ73_03160 [Rhodovulum viride]|uniref:Divergent polysaccharide deacetylase n=1 Tax=Rhodovulum viride TaxID=1231134 RepID=A0ABX9DN43_9RHOB|nr:hypothetical protein BYZ73_03160 [Rhodovulum viride]